MEENMTVSDSGYRIINVYANNAQISEMAWSFPANSSIGFFGYFGEPLSEFNKVNGCESFINQFNQITYPEFRFEYLGDNAPIIKCNDVSLYMNSNNLITNCLSVSFHLFGDINFRISYVGDIDIYGVNCESGL